MGNIRFAQAFMNIFDFAAAGAPEDVQMLCFSNDDRTITYTLVTWKAPKEARGTIQGYNVSRGLFV